MNILQINKFYQITGGVSRYFFELAKLLKIKGHQVAYFSMQDKKNRLTKWSKYFVSNISFEKVSLKNSLKVISRMIYSLESKRKISQLLDIFDPDIAHIHNIYHQISPSILTEIKRRNIPIVHTVGDYHLISPHHHNLFHDGKICEVSKRFKFYNTICHKCIKDSYLASFAEALEQYIHHFCGLYSNTVDYFISPSNFFAEKLREYGVSEDKILVLPYFVDYRNFVANYSPGNYILYFGRLSPEKGLPFLISVMKKLPHIKLKIAGFGPEGEKLRYKVQSDGLKNIEIISRFIEDRKLKKMISESRFLVFPSQSLETFGISLLEAYASGKPVVASRIGALPEVIKDGYTGFLFESNNISDCAEKINKLWTNIDLCKKIGRNARDCAEREYNPEVHYQKLMEIYQKAIK